ncbi:MAG: GspH/FimT family pseudopilin, partial [Parasphingopyxis sp.]
MTPGSDPARVSSGFTLIELMVVFFIVGLTATVVMISLPDGSREVRGDADRFAQRVAAARDEAVLESQPIALWVSPSGYGFERRREGTWQPIVQPPFDATDWRGGTVARVPPEGTRLVFDSVGLPSEAIAVT